MKKGFTLLEIVITLLVAFILVTVGGVSYRLVLEKARARVDEVNKQTLLKAMNVASLEAGVLGELDNEQYLQHIGNAYAEVMKESGWFTKFSYFFVRLNTSREVYANVGKYVDPQYMKKYGVDPQVFISPSDKNGPPSYGINAALEGLKWDEIDPGTIVIGDCDNANGMFNQLNELSARHYTTLESLVTSTPQTQVIFKSGEVFVGDIGGPEMGVGGGSGCGCSGSGCKTCCKSCTSQLCKDCCQSCGDCKGCCDKCCERYTGAIRGACRFICKHNCP